MQMSRRGFTLVELMISIFLLSIIAIFLYNTIGSLQKSNTVLSKSVNHFSIADKISDLLYDDIFLSSDINITDRDNTILQLQTKNSIYNIEMPYVSWFVARENDTLLRIESILPFSKKNSENANYYHISKVQSDCEKFKVMQSKKGDTVLIYVKFKSKEPILFEFPKAPIHTTQKKSSKQSVKQNKQPQSDIQHPEIKIE